MGTGGFFPGPWRTGPSKGATLEGLCNSLLAARGTTFDQVDRNTAVFVEVMAQARVLWDAWETLRRATLQWDPDRMTDFLPRWEAIFRISVPPGASKRARRAMVKRRFQQIGIKANVGGLNAILSQIFPDIFVTIVNDTTATAVSHTYFNVTVPGGVTIVGDGRWNSSIHVISVQVQQPGWMSDAAFYAQAAQLLQWVDPVLPSWCDIHWFRFSSADAIGFLLDDPHNLDNEGMNL